VTVCAGVGVARTWAAREAVRRTAGSILGVGVWFVSRGVAVEFEVVSVSRGLAVMTGRGG
jgi:hypothetical protein